MATLTTLLNNKVKAYALIVGMGSIGREFTKQLLHFKNDNNISNINVITASRTKPNNIIDELSQDEKERFNWMEMDINDENSIEHASNNIPILNKKDKQLCLLINTTGMLHKKDDVDDNKKFMPEKQLEAIDSKWLEESMYVNAFSHMLVAKHFAKHTCNKNEASIITSLSARVGSIEDNRLGGWYSYRASKAALNQLMRCTAIELNRRNEYLKVCLLHPGTVFSNMSQPFVKSNSTRKNVFTPQHSVDQMLNNVIFSNHIENGKFYAYDGTSIPF